MNPTNHWKLGLFVLVGFVSAAGAVVFLGARSLQTENVRYKSYFDESVQGLEVGSPVKFRGVTIGTVADIDVASDHRHVEVSCDLAVKDLNALGLSVEKAKGRDTKMKIPPDLRVQLVATGITGVQFIQIDFFNPNEYPPLQVPFDVPENYIPTAASMMKNLQTSMVQAVDKFPVLVEQIVVILARIADILVDIEAKKIPERASSTLLHLDAVLEEIRIGVKAVELGKVSKSTRDTLANLDTSLIRLNEVLGRMGGDKGLVASAQRTSDSLGSMAQNANHVGPALEDTLRDVQSAVQAIQRLANSLERDPDMLIKGRAKRPEQQ